MGTIDALNSSSSASSSAADLQLLNNHSSCPSPIVIRIGSSSFAEQQQPPSSSTPAPSMTYHYSHSSTSSAITAMTSTTSTTSFSEVEILREDSIVNSSIQELSLDTSDLLFLAAKNNHCSTVDAAGTDDAKAPNLVAAQSERLFASDLEQVPVCHAEDDDVEPCDNLGDDDSEADEDDDYSYDYNRSAAPRDNYGSDGEAADPRNGSLVTVISPHTSFSSSQQNNKRESNDNQSESSDDEDHQEEDDVFLPASRDVQESIRYSQICNTPQVAEEPDPTASTSDITSIATSVTSNEAAAAASSSEGSTLTRASSSSTSTSDTFVKPCDLVIKVNHSHSHDDSTSLPPYEKKYKSTSEISRHLLTATSSTSNISTHYGIGGGDSSLLPSPSSKSVKSLSALSPGQSGFLHRSWYSSISRMGRMKKLKKKSLTSMFDAIHDNSSNKVTRAAKSDYNLKSSSRTNVSLPQRANSTTAAVAHNTSSHLNSSRLATSDLRNVQMLERRCQSIDRGHEKLISDDFEADQEEEDKATKTNNNANGKSQSSRVRKVSPHPQTYFTIDSRRHPTRHTKKYSLRDKKLLYGIKQFNLEPKRGLEVLESSAFLPSNDPKAVAQFLFREGRLSKKQIGKYIGGHETSNKEVLRYFVRCHEFTHLILVQALRQFLWSFRLPGEAMQIDRIMEAFAERYCEQNPLLFEKRDTCYILSFSIIMLNTALHNPNVRQKITVEQFIKQNRGINSGKDLPKDILDLIYRSIKEEPFKIPDETYDDLMYTFFSPEKEGWLLKQGGSWKSWKRRWFVLSDRCLYYFQHTAENVPKGIIPLENVKVRPLEDTDGKGYCFELYSESNNVVKGCKTDSKGTVVQGNHKSYRMSASSAEERLYWVQCIQDSIREHPFHDIITSKKDALRRHNDPKQQSVRQQHPASLPPSVGTPVKLPRHAALQQAQQGPGTPGTPGKAGGGPRALFKGQMTSTPKTSGTPNENNNSALLGDKLI